LMPASLLTRPHWLAVAATSGACCSALGRALAQPHRRQRLAAGHRVGQCRAHLCHEALLVLPIAELLSSELRGVDLKIRAYELRMALDGLLRIDGRIAKRPGRLGPRLEERALLDYPPIAVPFEVP